MQRIRRWRLYQKPSGINTRRSRIYIPFRQGQEPDGTHHIPSIKREINNIVVYAITMSSNNKTPTGNLGERHMLIIEIKDITKELAQHQNEC